MTFVGTLVAEVQTDNFVCTVFLSTRVPTYVYIYGGVPIAYTRTMKRFLDRGGKHAKQKRRFFAKEKEKKSFISAINRLNDRTDFVFVKT